MSEINNLPTHVSDGQTGHLNSHQVIHHALKNLEGTPSRVEALEAREGLAPESPVDGQTANLISQPDTLTRSAVTTAVESRIDGRFLPNDPTYSMVPRLVHHGGDSRTPRPATDGPVIWLGIPLPIYSQPGDVLLRPAGADTQWSPDWLDLVGWYDPSTLTPDSAVTYVEDHSGHENHLDIPGGTGQITVDGSALAHPALYFDGESWISSGLLSQEQWTHPTTVWAVISSISVRPDIATIFDSADYATGGVDRSTRSTLFISNLGKFSSGAGSNHFGTGTVPESTPTLLMVNFAGDSTSFGEINGQHSFGPVNLGALSTSDSHRLGANGGGVNPYKGAVGEVIIAHGVTESEREATTSYLMEKWGIA